MKNRQYSECRSKVEGIFEELAGQRAEALDPTVHNLVFQEKIMGAFKGDLGEKKARLLGFHLADWNADAAFIVALHLFPERFTKRDIVAGVISFQVSATDHITAASVINGFPIEDPYEVGVIKKKTGNKGKKTTEPGVVADGSRLQEGFRSIGRGKGTVQGARKRARC
jgi:hypothetical protein